MTDIDIELVRQASQGVPRQVGRILRRAIRFGVPKGLNHILDDLIQQVIEELR
jgi:Holliday junction resolvasome RuvABC ATP-dependent DNA helicase subunit